jgi:hypothetical protein
MRTTGQSKPLTDTQEAILRGAIGGFWELVIYKMGEIDTEIARELAHKITPYILKAIENDSIHWNLSLQFSKTYADAKNARLIPGLIIAKTIKTVAHLESRRQLDTIDLSSTTEMIKKIMEDHEVNNAPVNDQLITIARNHKWKTVDVYLASVPTKKTSPQITDTLNAYAILNNKPDVQKLLRDPKFTAPTQLPQDAIDKSEIECKLAAYQTSNRFFPACLTPELDNLKKMLASHTYCTKDDIEWAITQAQSSPGSKTHRLKIFNNPSTAHQEDKTETSKVIRGLGNMLNELPVARPITDSDSSVLEQGKTVELIPSVRACFM